MRAIFDNPLRRAWRLRIPGLLALCLCSLSAQAEEPAARLYYGVGFSDGSVDIPGNADQSLGTISASVGLQLLDYIGVELQAGAASDQVDSMLSEPQVQYQAAMLRLGYRWDRTAIYLLGGQARLDIDSDLNNTDAGNVMGIGINLFGNETTALNMHVLRFDEGAFTTATIGFQYYFGGFR